MALPPCSMAVDGGATFRSWSGSVGTHGWSSAGPLGRRAHGESVEGQDGSEGQDWCAPHASRRLARRWAATSHPRRRAQSARGAWPALGQPGCTRFGERAPAADHASSDSSSAHVTPNANNPCDQQHDHRRRCSREDSSSPECTLLASITVNLFSSRSASTVTVVGVTDLVT